MPPYVINLYITPHLGQPLMLSWLMLSQFNMLWQFPIVLWMRSSFVLADRYRFLFQCMTTTLVFTCYLEFKLIQNIIQNKTPQFFQLQPLGPVNSNRKHIKAEEMPQNSKFRMRAKASCSHRVLNHKIISYLMQNFKSVLNNIGANSISSTRWLYLIENLCEDKVYVAGR